MGRAARGSSRLAVIGATLFGAVVLVSSSAGASSGGWSTPQILVPVGTATYNPVVATGPTGTTVAVWDEVSKTAKFSLYAAIRPPVGKTKKIKLGSMTGAFPQASLAVGGDGTFAAAWGYPGKGAQNRVAVRVWPHGKAGFGPTMFVSPGNASTQEGEGDSPQVAVDAAGTVYVVWEGLFKYKGAEHYRVVESQLGKGSSRWSSPQLLSSAGETVDNKLVTIDSHGARVAASGDGSAAVSWTQSTGEVEVAIHRAGDHLFGPARLISAATYAVSPPTVGVGDRGKTMVVWTQSATSGRRIESKVTMGSSFSSKAQLLSGTGIAQFQALALASDGSGVTAWERLTGGGGQVQARAMSPSGKSWGGLKQLTRSGVVLFGSGPSVAAAKGRAFVAWTQRVNNKLSVGVTALVGHHWSAAHTFPALGSAVVSAADAPLPGSRVLGALVWSTTQGLKLATFDR